MGPFCEISCGIVDSSDEVAVRSTDTNVCARDRTNSRFYIAVPERNDTARRDLRSVNSCGRRHCSSLCRFHSVRTSERVCGMRTCDRVCGTNNSSDYPCASKEDDEPPHHRKAITVRAAEVAAIL